MDKNELNKYAMTLLAVIEDQTNYIRQDYFENWLDGVTEIDRALDTLKQVVSILGKE